MQRARLHMSIISERIIHNNMFSLVSSEGVHTNHKRTSILFAQIQDFK